MTGEASFTADLQEALEPTQHSEGERHQPVWSALARVVDDSPVGIFSDGDSNGMTVTCRILSGPYVGSELPAMVSGPLGAGFESRPIVSGQRVLLQFVDGTIDGLVVAVANVPGGKENPIPTAIAGVDVVGNALQGEMLFAPPKKTNVRWYVRGAAFLIRLKGAQPGFAGEFYLEADDGDASGNNNTFLRLAMNPTTNKMSIKMKLNDGTAIAVDNGVASLTAPGGVNTLQVSDADVRVLANTFYVDATTIALNGNVMVNVPPGAPPPPSPIPALYVGSAVTPCPAFFNCPPAAPPLPIMAALHGLGGPTGAPSVTVWIGA